MYQHKEEDEIEKQSIKDFENTCHWFVDEKLGINFDENDTKLIPFASKRRSKNVRQRNIRYNHIIIKQHSHVTYLGCMLGDSMSGDRVALKVLNKINGKLKFLH